jgi:hypothetical protein
MSDTKLYTPAGTKEIFMAAVVVLSDILPISCDAMFIHGAPIRDDDLDYQLLDTASNLYIDNDVNNVVINGLKEADCRAKNLAYRGCEPWRNSLLEEVDDNHIFVLPPSDNTAIESYNLLLLAKEKGWENLIICSHPHHLLRCFLQIVAEMNKMDFFPNVYCKPGGGINWNRLCEKPVLKGGTGFTGDEKGPYHEMVGKEFERVVTYGQQPPMKDGKPAFIRHATLPEMFEYLKRRG